MQAYYTPYCKHSIHPIILGVSEPTYSADELSELNALSSDTVTIDGKERSRYEWTQVMRGLETEIRYAREEEITARAAGDDVLARNAETKVTKLMDAYDHISAKTDISVRRDRMYVLH